MVVVDMLASLLIAALSGMGVGSGGLLVMYLTLVHGTPQLQAQYLNLLFFIFASAASLCIHLTRRHIRPLPTLLLCLSGLLGSLLGARLALGLPEAWVSRLFGLFLVSSGGLTLLRGRKSK